MVRLAFVVVVGTLCVSSVLANDVVRRFENDPYYRISDLEQGDDQTLQFKFKKTQLEKHDVAVWVAQLSGGQLGLVSQINTATNDDSVAFNRTPSMSESVQVAMEIFLVIPRKLDERRTLYSKVSNSLRIGNPGTATKGRTWTPEEKRSFARQHGQKDQQANSSPFSGARQIAKPQRGTLFYLLLTSAGIFAILGAAFDWEFFMNSRKARRLVKVLGRPTVRIIYVVLGLIVTVLGLLLSLGILTDAS